ncbi:MAG: phosphoribosylamine--glycine ligase, partial [Methermicoccaceae archaeon]
MFSTSDFKVLLVGSGGREHAIAEAIVRSDNTSLYSYMAKRNPGIAELAMDVHMGDELTPAEVVQYATSSGVDCAIIGPEAPLERGVSDALEEAGIPVFSPSGEAARLELDKSWAREFMKTYSIPGCPSFFVCLDVDEASAAIEALDEKVVLKPTGLTGGKGVKVFGEHLLTREQALMYAKEVFSSGHNVVVEERLEGEEFTLQAFSDGKNLVFSPLVQDHKRAYEGDKGPNTGGMGSYSDADHRLPFVSEEDVKRAREILQLTIDAMRNSGTPYKGVLYGQFMLTANGPYVIEYNARFGDPEAMNVLPIMDTPFSEVIRAGVEGSLDKLDVRFYNKATVCKYLVPEGYPENPVSDSPIK